MALDTALLKPAQIGTSEIATKNDITTSLGAYNPAAIINTNTTTIDGGRITTGTITANQIAANTITSSQLTTGIALINGEVKSSDFTTIGGAGFRLKSNAAGTSADPTIYGAYIRGGTIDSSTLNVRNLNVIGDDGAAVEPFFIGSTAAPFSTTNLSYNVGIAFYGFGSTSNLNRLSSSSGCSISVAPSGIWCDSSGNLRSTPPSINGYITIMAVGSTNFNSSTVKLMAASNVLYSKTSLQNLVEFDLGGIGFIYFSATYYSYTFYFLAIRQINTNVSITSLINSPIYIEVTFPSSYSSYDRLSQLSFAVNNMT